MKIKYLNAFLVPKNPNMTGNRNLENSLMVLNNKKLISSNYEFVPDITIFGPLNILFPTPLYCYLRSRRNRGHSLYPPSDNISFKLKRQPLPPGL